MKSKLFFFQLFPPGERCISLASCFAQHEVKNYIGNTTDKEFIRDNNLRFLHRFLFGEVT